MQYECDCAFYIGLMSEFPKYDVFLLSLRIVANNIHSDHVRIQKVLSEGVQL